MPSTGRGSRFAGARVVGPSLSLMSRWRGERASANLIWMLIKLPHANLIAAAWEYRPSACARRRCGPSRRDVVRPNENTT